MYKYGFLIGVALLYVASTQGADGLYVGGSQGGSATIARQQGDMLVQFRSVDPIFFPMDLRTDFFEKNVEGVFFAGYGARWRSLYAGLEGFIRYSHPNFSIHKRQETDNRPLVVHNLENTSHVEIGPWHFGIDGRAGFFMKPSTLLYGRLGVECTKIHLSNTSSHNGFSSDDFFTITTTPSIRKHSAYLRVGAGIEQDLTAHLSFRADYLYTDYRNISVEGRTTGVSSTGNFLALSDNPDVHLKNHALTLGLAYYFCNTQPYLSECHDPHFCGVYLGGALGGSVFDGQADGDPRAGIDFFSFPIIIHLTPSPHIVESNFLGMLLLGYGLQWRCFYLGLEAFGRFSRASKTLQDRLIFDFPAIPRLFDVSFKTGADIDPWQFGIDARPGFMLTPSTLLFAAIGTSRASIEAHSMGRGFFISPDGLIELKTSKKAKRATLRLGGGIEYALNSCWHLRADYRYTNYGSLRLKGSTESTQGIATFSLIEKTRIRLRTHDITLGIARYF